MMLQGSPLPTDLEQPKSACPQLDGTSEESSEGCLAEQVSSAVMLGLKSECASVWFHCGAYERAESRYYVRLQEDENGTASSTSSVSATCQPGAQDACHRMVQSVWVNKPVFDLAEQRFAEGVPQRPFLMDAPLSLPLQARGPAAETPSDEGYLSLTPTPCASVPRPINGLPRLPAHLLGVWLQKPLYDRAEAAFYESVSMQTVSFGNLDTDCKEEAGQEGINNSINKESEPETLSQQPPDDEGEDVGAEEEEDDDDAKIVENGKDRTLSHFLHSDSERVWLDHGCYVEAETRYHERESAQFQTMQTSLITQGQSQMENMTGVDYLAQEKIWFDKPRYDEAEKQFYERMNGPTPTTPDSGANSILQDIARARENIQKSLAGLKTTLLPNRSPAHISPYPSLPQSAGCSSADQGELLTRMENMELENQSLHKVVEELRSALVLLENRVSLLERRPLPAVNAASPVVSPAAPQKAPAATTNDGADDEGDDDDDFDLFGSDEEEDEEAERIKEERLREYTERKAKKPAIIAKSSILLDVKPWDDETDMAKLEECVRSVQADGLLWGSSKLIPVGYGIKKLQIQCVVEDDKVGTDLLEEEITKFEDYVQSVDVAAFNKI